MSSKQKTPMEDLVGPSLLTKVGTKKSTAELLKGKDLVLLYFSASWCPPCQKFSPLLSSWYQLCAKKGNVEVIYVSSDRDIPSFEGYYGKMPWLAIPAEGTSQIKNKLAQALNIRGIPALVVLEAATGKFVTDNARVEVTRVGENAEEGAKLIASWKEKEAVPLEEAVSQQQQGHQNPVVAFIFMILKNPVYIFGMIYLFKMAMRKLAEFRRDGEEAAIEHEVDAAKDQEF